MPGLLVAVPSTPADAKGLLKAAIRDDNPVIFIEHEYLYGQRGEVPEDDDHLVNFGEAVIRREGSDVTIVGISRMASTAEKAAKMLSEEHGIEAEVIDPRTLRPLDLDTILASVRKTNRCVIVEEGWPHGGVGANLAALVQEQAFDDLDAPVGRVTGADVPMPYAKNLEQIAFPHEPQVVEAVLRDLPRPLGESVQPSAAALNSALGEPMTTCARPTTHRPCPASAAHRCAGPRADAGHRRRHRLRGDHPLRQRGARAAPRHADRRRCIGRPSATSCTPRTAPPPCRHGRS